MKRITFLFPFIALLGIVLFSGAVRWFRLGNPDGYIFDERYHVPAVRLLAERDVRAFEWWHEPVYGTDHFDWLHPPLAKYIQAGFFHWFGGDVQAIRVASVLFGVAGILLVFGVAQTAFRNTNISLLSAFLLSLDGLWLVQSRVAMNDVFVTVFLLIAMWLYLLSQRKNKSPHLFLFVGVLLGLAVATKWSAIVWMSGLLVWECVGLLKTRAFRWVPWIIFCFLLVPLVVYAAAFIPALQYGKTASDLIELHRQTILYQWAGDFVHPAQSQPWEWIINIAPVQYWQEGSARFITAFNNPLLAWLSAGGILASVLAIARRRVVSLPMALITFLVGWYVLFASWSPRILFYYHFTPLLPMNALLLSYWLHRFYFDKTKRSFLFVGFMMLCCLVWVFWLYYPYWVGLPVSSEYTQAFVQILPGWE